MPFYHQNCATRLSLIAIQVSIQCQLLCSDETNYPEFGKTVLSCWFWHNRNMDYNIHGSGKKQKTNNLQYHVSERLDIPEAPLWLFLELLSRLGHQLRAQGTGVDGWRRPWEPALSHSCWRVHWRRPEVDLMLISHGLTGWSCVRDIKWETSVCTVFSTITAATLAPGGFRTVIQLSANRTEDKRIGTVFGNNEWAIPTTHAFLDRYQLADSTLDGQKWKRKKKS